MSDKIPTAAEVLQSNLQFSQDGHPIWTESSVLNAIKEYGNNIREAALKAASEKAKFFPISTWNCEPRGVQPEVNKQSILNAYPKENIT